MQNENYMDKLKRIFELTEIIKKPKKKIATFWNTEIEYNVISPIAKNKSCLRKGIILCKKPTIITMQNLSSFFSDFDEEEIYFAKRIAGDFLDNLRLLGYQFTHTKEKEMTVNSHKEELAKKVLKESSGINKFKTAVIIAPDDIWSFSLINLFFEILRTSYKSNFNDLNDRGFFKTEEERVRDKVEALFLQAKQDRNYIDELADKLQEYDLFSEYEDKFFELVKTK